MRQGYFALLTADPLRGALNRVEARLIEEARGEALFLIPYALRDLAEAWRLVYRDLGLRRGRVVYLRRREEAFDPEVARRVAENGEREELAPMTPFERKIVHDAVAAVDGVHSESEGVEPSRRVVVLKD